MANLVSYLESVKDAARNRDGTRLSGLLTVQCRALADAVALFSTEIKHPYDSSSSLSRLCEKCINDELWAEIAAECLLVADSCFSLRDLSLAYEDQSRLAIKLNRIAEKNDRWIIPVLYRVASDLKDIAIQLDVHETLSKSHTAVSDKQSKLEAAARVINRSLTVCLNDRSSAPSLSRKSGVYLFICLLFKTYFRLGNLSLATSVIRVLNASSNAGDVPSLDTYPKAHIVTFRYYAGVLAFAQGDYDKAEEHLSAALDICHRRAIRNQELILTYLLPIHILLHRRFPRDTIWSIFPNLSSLYQSLFSAAKRGDLRTFESCLAARERAFINRRLYLSMTEIRGQIVRPRFFEKVHAIDNSTRMPIHQFQRALKLMGIEVNEDQVECWAASMIYQGHMKGYISHERSIIVLSNTDPFPK
ncbi:uncharacterized protein V1516DRAFT_621073 [Lipomyces oligophaga]|uniref:uncharacterized protein n=1 Tax=Lipomyces oligophaga TaxID=45792 RepID=UPI0034CF6608